MRCERCGKKEQQYVSGKHRRVVVLAEDAYSLICSICTYYMGHRSMRDTTKSKEGK